GIAPEFLQVAPDAALVLMPAPDHFGFALALPLGDDVKHQHAQADQHGGAQKHREQHGVAGVAVAGALARREIARLRRTEETNRNGVEEFHRACVYCDCGGVIGCCAPAASPAPPGPPPAPSGCDICSVACLPLDTSSKSAETLPIRSNR